MLARLLIREGKQSVLFDDQDGLMQDEDGPESASPLIQQYDTIFRIEFRSYLKRSFECELANCEQRAADLL